MAYSDWMSSIALVISLLSLGWNVYSWLKDRKKEETPRLRVYVKKLSGKTTSYSFVIENKGTVEIKILSCWLNGVDITECRSFLQPCQIVNAIIQPQNKLQSPFLVTNKTLCNEYKAGSLLKIKYIANSKKKYEEEFSLNTEN